MDEIKFSYNWNNKLDCKAFTTIRIENPNKYKVGHLYYIKLKEEHKGNAACVAIKSFFLKDLNDFIAHLDTGYDRFECEKIIRRMYPNVDFNSVRLYLILLKQI